MDNILFRREKYLSRIRPSYDHNDMLRYLKIQFSCMQVAYTIMLSKETENRENKSLEMIKDIDSKCVATKDYMFQKRNGISHINIVAA